MNKEAMVKALEPKCKEAKCRACVNGRCINLVNNKGKKVCTFYRERMRQIYDPE